MSENVKQEQQEEATAFSKEQVAELVAKEVEGLKNKNDELLGKLKEYKEHATTIKTEAEKAREEALKKNGDIEELKAFYAKQIEEKEQTYLSQINELTSKVKERDKLEVINKLTGDFVDSEAGSFMLKQLVDVEDGSTKFRDFAGNIVADNVDDYKTWMKSNPHMQALLRGSNATGGNAPGGSVGDGESKTLKRSQVDAMPPAQRMEFFKSGGKTIDD